MSSQVVAPVPTAAEIPWNKKKMPPLKIAGIVLGYVLMIGVAAFVLLPFVWMVLASLKPNNEVFLVPVKWFPSVWHWDNYIKIWTDSNMLTWLGNTVFFAICVTFLQVFTGSFAAYGFSKIRFRGRNVLFLIYIATMAVPWQAYMIPQYKMLSAVHLTDTRWSIILLQAFGAFGVFMMKQFYEGIPTELCEAARIDGMSEYQIWYRVMLPLSKPALSTLLIFTFVNTWNDFLGPLIYLTTESKKTLQLGLRMFISQFGSEYGLIMAASVLSLIPVLIVFLSLQKYFVEGVAATGVKG